MVTIVRAPNGTARRQVLVSQIAIPDLWHIAMALKKDGDIRSSEAVLECWSLCHDLLETVKSA